MKEISSLVSEICEWQNQQSEAVHGHEISQKETEKQFLSSESDSQRYLKTLNHN